MAILRIALKSIRAFFDIQKTDTVRVTVTKVACTIAKRTTYVIADYWLAFVTAFANITLKVNGIDIVYAFAVMWLLNVTISWAFVAFYMRTGVDISLGVDLRRATDKIHEESRIAGYFSIAGIMLQAIFWSGPEQIVIFFQKELYGWRRWVALLVLTGVQTIIWMFLYRTGYDVISGG